jgi:hypothetical protein
MSIWSPMPPPPPIGAAPPGGTPPGWQPDGCQDSGNFTQFTVCRRPYGLSAYGGGPFGRCPIVGGGDWAPSGALEPSDPFWTPAPNPP